MGAVLSIDLETFSTGDIRYGVHKYVNAADFRILLFAYAFNDEPVTVLDLACGEKLPDNIKDALYAPDILKTAFNANFEITCLKKYFPDLPTEQWECDSVLALYNSYPASLDAVAKALHLKEQKDATGKALIQYFSKPCKPTKTNGGRTRNLPQHDPEKWELFIEYNRQDVEVERAIRKALIENKPPEQEHKLWLLDQRINETGIAVNRILIENAINISEQETALLTEKAREITGLNNPNSLPQLKKWLGERIGFVPSSLTKESVEEILKKLDLTDEVKSVLRLRRQLGKTSIKKYEAMQNSICPDGRIHDIFQFYGAPRTGRWAGRNVQLHNLPRNGISDLDNARNLVLENDFETFSLLYDVQDTLSQLLRTTLIPSEGSRFIVADFSAIEARVLAWLAVEKWRLDVFRKGGDIYCASASAMFGVPVEKHGVNGHLRQKGKIAELALGYGGGVGALKAMGADKMGLSDNELTDIVQKWRKANPNIINFWRGLELQAKMCLDKGGSYGRFYLDEKNLRMVLPNGRTLTYLNATFGENRFGGTSIIYDGVEQVSGKWGRLETYAGKLTENLVQAVARDCLAAAMLRLDAAGYKIVMHVHDEVIIEMPEEKGSLENVIEIMTQNESWNQGLPLDADGFETKYYKKD